MSLFFPETFRLSLLTFWDFLKAWWWVAVPLLLFKPLLYLYYFWRMELWDNTVPKVVLEIKIPKEVIKPIRAMEDVFAGFHAIHDVITWREKWIEGQFQLSFTCEIVSIGGEIHFFIRTPTIYRNVIESNIYAQYPEAEIFEVADYTKNVPPDIPNKEWDLFGANMINTKPDPYPIKTYKQFEIETQAKEEKRIDPMAGLLEGMTTLVPGEQLWLQIRCTPIREEKPWKEQGKEIRDKLARRPEKAKKISMFREAFDVFLTGYPPAAKEVPKEVIPPEMKLTPGEREILQAIEEKISKFGFDCCIRFIYLGKRDVFWKAKSRFPYGFFKDVSSESLGGFKPHKQSFPKVKSPFFWFLDDRRVFSRKRKLFRHYVKRWKPYFPRGMVSFVLNTEELATLFHFPGKTVAPAPTLPRIEAKKSEAPPGLPVE